MNELTVEQVKAAESAVADAMHEYGPDGHVDGHEEVTRFALEAVGLKYPAALGSRGVPDWPGRSSL